MLPFLQNMKQGAGWAYLISCDLAYNKVSVDYKKTHICSAHALRNSFVHCLCVNFKNTCVLLLLACAFSRCWWFKEICHVMPACTCNQMLPFTILLLKLQHCNQGSADTRVQAWQTLQLNTFETKMGCWHNRQRAGLGQKQGWAHLCWRNFGHFER